MLTLLLLLDLYRSFVHDTSGMDGESGQAGNAGQKGTGVGGIGLDAASGSNGQHGTAASSNVISIMSVPDQKIFIVSPKDSGKDAVVLPLFDGQVSVSIKARGGVGGNGGHGGKGQVALKFL